MCDAPPKGIWERHTQVEEAEAEEEEAEEEANSLRRS